MPGSYLTPVADTSLCPGHARSAEGATRSVNRAARHRRRFRDCALARGDSSSQPVGGLLGDEIPDEVPDEDGCWASPHQCAKETLLLAMEAGRATVSVRLQPYTGQVSRDGESCLLTEQAPSPCRDGGLHVPWSAGEGRFSAPSLTRPVQVT